jgi:hypothetical protein
MDKYSTMTLVLSLLMASAPSGGNGYGYHAQRFHCDPGACPVQHTEMMPKPSARQSKLARAEKPDNGNNGG